MKQIFLSIIFAGGLFMFSCDNQANRDRQNDNIFEDNTQETPQYDLDDQRQDGFEDNEGFEQDTLHQDQQMHRNQTPGMDDRGTIDEGTTEESGTIGTGTTAGH